MAEHKHAELIHKWADGAKVETFDQGTSKWYPCPKPFWDEGTQYRVVQPQPMWMYGGLSYPYGEDYHRETKIKNTVWTSVRTDVDNMRAWVDPVQGVVKVEMIYRGDGK
jgi:hypothetical protein